MMSASSETIWSSMIAARQLSVTYYTLSTCLTDLLHRYFEISSSQDNLNSSPLFRDLDQTLFSPSTSQSQWKLLEEYSTILQNILKQNSIHTNIIQNVRRLFRFDSCLKQLFTTELNEHCQCQECDCTISNSITDVIHEVGNIRTTLLTESSQTSCTCFRCGDQNQIKTLTFKQFSPCLALIVNRLNITATDHLTTNEGVIYDLTYVIEFDSISRSVINVYLREGTELIKVDGTDISSRSATLNCQGKFLTLWLRRSTSAPISQPLEPLPTLPQHDTFLSPPQSASSSSQLISNSTTNIEALLPYQCANTSTFDDIPIEPDATLNEKDDFADLFNFPLTEPSESAVFNEDTSSATTNDVVSDLYLTLLHSTNKEPSPVKSRVEHDRRVSALAADAWSIIVEQTNRRSEQKSASSVATTRSISSNSSTTSSMIQRNRVLKPLPSTAKSRRAHPYAKA